MALFECIRCSIARLLCVLGETGVAGACPGTCSPPDGGSGKGFSDRSIDDPPVESLEPVVGGGGKLFAGISPLPLALC